MLRNGKHLPQFASLTFLTSRTYFCQLHSIDVKLIGKMQAIDDILGGDSAGYQRFKLTSQQDHVVLHLPDGGEEFGYLRSAVGKTLAPLLSYSYIEFEPLVSTMVLKETIARASKPADAIVKIDVNVYGREGVQAATQVGDALSRGKLWLQKPSHARREAVYENPHFLSLKINGVQIQPAQPVGRVATEGLASKKRRVERLRLMVEEVYKSMDHNRHLEMVEGGSRVTVKLLQYVKLETITRVLVSWYLLMRCH